MRRPWRHDSGQVLPSPAEPCINRFYLLHFLNVRPLKNFLSAIFPAKYPLPRSWGINTQNKYAVIFDKTTINPPIKKKVTFESSDRHRHAAPITKPLSEWIKSGRPSVTNKSPITSSTSSDFSAYLPIRSGLELVFEGSHTYKDAYLSQMFNNFYFAAER